MRFAFLSAAFALAMIQGAPAADCVGDACCETASCGCPTGCCQVVCEMKTVKKTVWVVECEEFCTMLPGLGCASQNCCNACTTGTCCGGCDCCCDPCAALNNRKYVTPRCSNVKCKKTLVKKEIECQVPVYKCVPVSCGADCGAGEAEPAVPAAAPLAYSPTGNQAPLPPVMSMSYQQR